MIVMGLSAAYIGSTYNLGTLTKMGPGFFPACLGVLMAFMGVLIALANARAAGAPMAVDPHHGIAAVPDWRGWACICGAVIGFIVLAEYAGLLPATFFCVFIAALGDRSATLKASALLAAGITAFGLVLFSYVLRVQIPVI